MLLKMIKKLRKISLRLRITLLVGGLLTVLTTVLTVSSILGANQYFVSPQANEAHTIEMKEDTRNSESKKDGENENAYDSNSISTFLAVTEAQRGFSFQSIIVSIMLVVLGLILTYWILGKALRPLTNLSETIHNINEHNLNKSIAMTHANDEIQSLTVSFNEMLDRLKNSFSRQKRFSASAAHELKTPLTTMKTSLQVLALEESPSIEEYSDTIGVIEQSVDQLILTVNDLLLLSSERRTELNDEISLHELFNGIVQDLKEMMQKKKITYTLPQHDCLIIGNQVLLKSVFYNIYENAVKYNKYGGSIVVLYKKESNGQVFVSICDTGIGMHEEELAFVFEPFFRVERLPVQQIPGNGLGLSIIKTIVDRHGGKIEIESVIGVGTKVIVIL